MLAKQIAIDGPAGAGKSTVAKLVADRLGYLYIDTGAMYRAIALLALRSGVAVDDEDSLTKLAEQTKLTLKPALGGCQVLIDGEDVSQAIRHPDVGNAASPVSAVPGVRQILVALQQRMAEQQPVVMDGRDIGSVVLPAAECKIFLTASPRIRAQRRTDELLARGCEADIDLIEHEINERDLRDSTRTASPLVQTPDAHFLDSSTLTIDQVVDAIIKLAEV